MAYDCCAGKKQCQVVGMIMRIDHITHLHTQLMFNKLTHAQCFFSRASVSITTATATYNNPAVTWHTLHFGTKTFSDTRSRCIHQPYL